MAPATIKRRTKALPSTTRRIITRSIYKKQQLLKSQEELYKIPSKKKTVSKSSLMKDFDDSSTTTTNDEDFKSFDDSFICLTPKSEKYKIPDIMTCPPAPKKPRVSPSNKWLIHQRRRPITFFAHPDLDKFFMFAMRDIKV